MKNVKKALLILVLACLALPASAEKVVLRIRVFKKGSAEKHQVLSFLPDGVTSNDVLSTGGLSLRYDIKQKKYYVAGEADFSDSKEREYLVEIRDIWTIAPEELTGLAKRAGELTEKLKDRPEDLAVAQSLETEIKTALSEIEKHQADNALRAGTRAHSHIDAFNSNMEKLDQVKLDVRKMENLVLSAGIDPGGFVWVRTDEATPKEEKDDGETDYREAVIEITVKNPSSIQKLTRDISRELPSEIGRNDIIDAGGLEIVADSARGVCYAQKKGVEVEPLGSVTFKIKVKDKWNTGRVRVDPMKARISGMSALVKEAGGFESVLALLEELQKELDAISSEAGPTELNEQYVAFYRDQNRRLNLVAGKIDRIENEMRQMRPDIDWGFTTPAPDPKTTWIIIYGIIGFLGLMSLLFFIRWFGKK